MALDVPVYGGRRRSPEAALPEAALEASARLEARMARIEAIVMAAHNPPEAGGLEVEIDFRPPPPAAVAASGYGRPFSTPWDYFSYRALPTETGERLRLEPVWEEEIGQPGYPHSGGYLEIDSNPELAPALARGSGGDQGLFEQLANLSILSGAIEGPIKSVAGLRWYTEQAPMQAWWTAEDRDLAAKHALYIGQVMELWGEEATSDLVEGILRTTVVRGFSLHEITTETRPIRVGGYVEYLPVPLPPAWINPSAVKWWLTDRREKPIGVALDFGHVITVEGYDPGYRLVPWRKLLHVAFRASGSNLEGWSGLRPVWVEANMYKAVRELWMLAIEVNSLGDRVVELGENAGGPFLDTLRTNFRNFVARLVPYLILPAGSTYKWISANQSIPDFSAVLDSLKADIAAGLDNTSDLIGVLHSGGAYALKKETSAEARKNLQYVVRRLVGQPVSSQVFKTCLELAFPNDPRHFAPLFRPEDVEQRDVSAWIATVGAAEASRLLRGRGEIAKEVRARLGLPRDLEASEYYAGERTGETSAGEEAESRP